MADKVVPLPRRAQSAKAYVLDNQIGFILRQVSQRHSLIFAELIGDDLTPTQWAALAKLAEIGPTSQNLLGRLTAMDAATIKGVVLRLIRRKLVETRSDPGDARRLVVQLTAAGEALVARLLPNAGNITEVTLASLSSAERDTLAALLAKLR
jgi:DNA-binding MarR family transcriptional regulator